MWWIHKLTECGDKLPSCLWIALIKSVYNDSGLPVAREQVKKDLGGLSKVGCPDAKPFFCFSRCSTTTGKRIGPPGVGVASCLAMLFMTDSALRASGRLRSQ